MFLLPLFQVPFINVFFFISQEKCQFSSSSFLFPSRLESITKFRISVSNCHCLSSRSWNSVACTFLSRSIVCMSSFSLRNCFCRQSVNSFSIPTSLARRCAEGAWDIWDILRSPGHIYTGNSEKKWMKWCNWMDVLRLNKEEKRMTFQ